MTEKSTIVIMALLVEYFDFVDVEVKKGFRIILKIPLDDHSSTYLSIYTTC